ncbi:MAG: 4'-phosphopantetheinyl transferase superfamily protein [bacterium]|nr:4'-phosphopantetheinyl transferase superfamily protein [bacterium]MDZ4284642.1 4'-phosphopantetheinyl transferase superfamily protein [Patescibacteria group bacterium]
MKRKSGPRPGTSIGVDLEQIRRFRAHSFSKEKRFWVHIFSARELERLATYTDPYPHAAGMFTAKEAVVKSLSFFKKKLSIRDIEVLHEKDGRPIVFIRSLKDMTCQVSISHTLEYACAAAVCQETTSNKKYGTKRNTRAD